MKFINEVYNKRKVKALVYKGKERVELEEREYIPPKDDEVTIRIRRVSICGSDLGAYRFPSERFATPLVLGHEFSGNVEAVGKDVVSVKPGGRVTANPMIPCGECFYCKRGDTNLCGSRRSKGTAIGGVRTDGAMQEYVTVKENMVIPIADHVSYQEAALLEPCGVTLACAKTGYTKEEKSVVIIGAGPKGLLILKFLKTMGVPNVICLGSAINQSFRLVRNGGSIVLVALMHEQVQIDPMEIVGRGL